MPTKLGRLAFKGNCRVRVLADKAVGRSGNVAFRTFLEEKVEGENRGWGVFLALSAADGRTHLLSLKRDLCDLE